jgi:transposase
MRRQRAALERRDTIYAAMKNIIPSITIGLDLGDKKHAICVLDQDSAIIDERTITNHRDSLRRLSLKYPRARIALEVGSHSPWTSRFFKELGHEVLVANPRKLRAIYSNNRKSDQNDARMIARLARVDPELLHPIQHSSEQSQRDLLQIKLRDNLVRQRVDIISSIRFTLKSLGVSLPSPNTACFAKRCRSLLHSEHAELLVMIEPSLQVIDILTKNIRELDKAIEQLCVEKYPATVKLRQICGVGAITSLCYILTIEDPQRFESPRDVAAYLGLVPKRDQSGQLDKQLRISKAGDAYLRRLLVGAAQYILGSFGPDSDLRRHGLELAARGGARAKKKAVVAIARKLAVLLLVLWKNQQDYQALRQTPTVEAA